MATTPGIFSPKTPSQNKNKPINKVAPGFVLMQGEDQSQMRSDNHSSETNRHSVKYANPRKPIQEVEVEEDPGAQLTKEQLREIGDPYGIDQTPEKKNEYDEDDEDQ